MDEDANLPPEKLLESFFLEEGFSSFKSWCRSDQVIIDFSEILFNDNPSNTPSFAFANDNTDVWDKLLINFSGLKVRPTFDQVVQILSAVQEILDIGGDDREV
jgi:hypothetical protein